MKSTLLNHLFSGALRQKCLLLLGLILCLPHFVFSQTFSSNHTEGCTPLGVVISVTSPAAGSISSYLWTITAPNGTVQTATGSNYIAILSAPGGYDVSLTINGNQNNTINDYITVYSNPTANFTNTDPEGCFPLCVDFTDVSVQGSGNIVEWNWDFGDGGTSQAQNPTYCYTQVGTFSPVFSVEDEHGCFADISMPGLITVVDNFPTAQFTLSSQLDCNPPVNISMTNTSTGTSSLTSEWSFGDGQTQNLANTNGTSHTYNLEGNYDVCLTVTDQIGCQDELCKPLTIFGTANATFTTNAIEACEGEPITFTSTTTPTPPQVAWDFNGDGVIDSNNPTATYSYANSGNYSPTLTATYSAGCSDVASNVTNINIIDGINVSFVADDVAACSFPFTVNFNNQSTGNGTITYQWYVNNVIAGTTEDFVYVFNSYGAFDIKLKATNSFGCENVLVMNDYILVQAPQVDFNNEPSTCTSENVQLFDIIVTCVEPIVNYSWDFESDGTYDAFGLAPSFSYSSPGVYHITLTIQSESGCTASYTNTQTINVLTATNATFTSSTNTTCAGQPVEFCVTDQPGNTFSWNFFDGSGWVIMPMNEYCLVHDYTDTGYFDVQLTVFNGACSGSITITNFIYVAPPVALFDYAIDCDNLTGVQFIDNSIEADSIVWDFGDGSPLVINELNPLHTYASSGEYTVTIFAFSDEGCPDSQQAPVVVSAPDPSITFDPPNGCPPLVVGIENNSFNTNWQISVSNGDLITANWVTNLNQWQVQYSHDGTTQTFLYGNINSLNFPDLTIEEAGFYDVTVTVINENGCESSIFYDDAIHVTANPGFASFNATPIDSCNSVQIAFQPDLPNLATFQWIFSDGTVSTQENPTHTFNPPYNYNNPLTATLTAHDADGCISTVTQQIDLVLPPVVDFIVFSDPSCQGDEVGFDNMSSGPTGTTYLWTFGDTQSASNTSTDFEPTHIYDANGTYAICLTADNGAGCSITQCNEDAVHVINPVVSFNYNPTINNCLYGVQFQNTTPGVIIQSAWDYGDDQSGFGINTYHTYPIGVYDVSLTVTNQYGCQSTLTVPDILNYGNQVGPFSQVLDSAACAPFGAGFTAFNPNDTYFDYFWDFNDGGGDPSGATIVNHNYLQPGTYCPSLIMTDPNGCNVLIACTNPITVEEFVMDYSASDYLCFGDTLALTIGNVETLSWNDMSQLTQGAAYNQFYLHPFDDTAYYLTGTYSDCVRTDTINIEVKDLPVVTLDITNSVCYGEDIFNLYGGAPQTPAGTYYIDGVQATEFNPLWAAETSYDLMYLYTDTFQCSNTAAAQIYLHQLPLLNYADYTPACDDAALINLNTAQPSGGVYNWLGDTLNTFDPAHGDGIYTINYTYTDQYNCTNSDASFITIYPTPAILLEYDNICQDIGLEVQNLCTISSGTITQAQWNFGAAGMDNNFIPSPKYYPTIGNKTFSLTLTSNQNCTSTLDTTVSIWAVPVVLFSPHDACQNESQLMVDESTLEEGNIVQWLWNVENQTIDSPDSLFYTFNNWGDINVSLTPITDHGCDDTLTVGVVVHPSPAVSLVMQDGCLGTENHFHADALLPFGSVVSQEWQFGDNHPNEYDADADNQYDATGTYVVQYTAISNLGCTSIVQDTLVVYAKPEVDFAAQPTALCAGIPFTLLDLSTVDSPSNLAEWHWYIGTTEIGQQQVVDTFWIEPGTYNLTLEVTSDHNCSADSTAISAVTFYPRPTAAFFSNEHAIMYSPVIEILNEASEDVTDWHYDFGDGNSESFIEGSYTYNHWGNYEIQQIVQNTFGCKDTAVRTIEITPDMLVYIPNAFTPDGNGHNEIFIPVTSGFDITHYEFMIFDRWGTQIFSSTEPNNGWDGTFRGEYCADGAYSWRLLIRSNFDPTIKELKGAVTLLK